MDLVLSWNIAITVNISIHAHSKRLNDVILGNSVPVTDFSTDSLRWLNNAQALEDSANFMANVKFPGIDEDLTAPNTPWIYYGVRRGVHYSELLPSQ